MANNISDNDLVVEYDQDQDEKITLQRRKQKINFNNQNDQNIVEKVKADTNKTKQQEKHAKNNKLLFLINKYIMFTILLLIIILFIIWIVENLGHQSNKINPDSALKNVHITLKSLKLKYKNQDKSFWDDIFVSIKMIMKNPKEPVIIILLADKQDPLDCFVKLIANVSSNALNTGSIRLTPENFDTNTGSVITSIVPQIEDKKIVIIWDLLNVNVEAFKAFHYLCDTVNPIIKNVIYIITIIADNYDNKSNPLDFIEKKIWEKLNGKVKNDSIQPLITRITDGTILKVKAEPTVIDCPLPIIISSSIN